VKITTLSDKGVLDVSYSHFKPLKIFRQIGQKWRLDIQNRHWKFRTDVGRRLLTCSENENVCVKIITLSDKRVLDVSYSHFKPRKIFRQIGQKWRVDIQNRHWTFRTDVGRRLLACSENENVCVKIITLSDKRVLDVSYSHFKPLKIFRQIGQKWRVDIQNGHWTFRTDVGRWLP